MHTLVFLLAKILLHIGKFSLSIMSFSRYFGLSEANKYWRSLVRKTSVCKQLGLHSSSLSYTLSYLACNSRLHLKLLLWSPGVRLDHDSGSLKIKTKRSPSDLRNPITNGTRPTESCQVETIKFLYDVF